MPSENTIEIQGIEVALKDKNDVVYISLTDIAKRKNPEFPAEVIIKWMSNKDSFDFYCLWEEIFNLNFNLAESRQIKQNEVGYNSFVMSPSKWKKRTNAIGIIPSAGKYSVGTFAHPDIAMEFASWIDTTFKLYLIKEFQRLKYDEQKALEWTAKRELAKINYRLHTDAIKNSLIVPKLNSTQIAYIYANEADLLNVALFGLTANEWARKNKNKRGNMRDYANINQLLVLANLESYNAILIKQNMPQNQRIVMLNEVARNQLLTLASTKLDEQKLLGNIEQEEQIKIEKE